MPPRSGGNVGGQNPEFIFREFAGVNNLNSRECIDDNEFYWCENAIPVAPGKLYPVPTATLLSVTAETAQPTYCAPFTSNGVNFAFVVFANTGNAYVVELFAPYAWSRIYTGGLTSGLTYATPYNDQGLLIVDPTGYWDYGVTTPGTLTPQNNTVSSTQLDFTNRVAGGSQLKQVLTAGTGIGATFQTVYEVVLVTLFAAGTGYAVGDTINLTDGNPTSDAQIVVASISGGGATGPVATITLSSGGSYPGPTSSTLVATGPTGSLTSTTGGGSGAAFTVQIVATGCNILTRGYGATGLGLIKDELSSGAIADQFTALSSGVIAGTSIATYQGRVWIGFGRTVYFTDIDSYVSFGGVGGSFTISDSYLYANITLLFAANNYLYIFGDTSIDALSNVTVSAGVTSFSRINVTGSIGCSQPASAFAYYRGIVFFNTSGIYLLSGATPEKLSEKISGVIQNVGGLAFGAQVTIQGELCAVFQFLVDDTFTTARSIRPLFVLFFRGRWWFYSFAGGGNAVACFGIASAGGSFVLFAIRATGTVAQLYQCLTPAAALSAWTLLTKLWDGGSPVHEKQSINIAIAGTYTGAISSGVQVTVDTELGSSGKVPLNATAAGYNFEYSLANEGGSQYLGMTLTGSVEMSQINLIAMRGKQDRDMLQ